MPIIYDICMVGTPQPTHLNHIKSQLMRGNVRNADHPIATLFILAKTGIISSHCGARRPLE